MSQGRRRTGDSFRPELYDRPKPLVEVHYGPHDSPTEARRCIQQEPPSRRIGVRWTAQKQLEVEQPVELEHLYCARCRDHTVHVPVYWYMARHQYDPPLELATGELLAGLEARVEVLWCVRHRGDPPVRYPEPEPMQLGG